MIKGNEAAIEELVRGVCNIDYKLLIKQKKKILLMSNQHPTPGNKKAVDGLLSLIDFLQDWMEYHPEVIFDTKL